MVEVLVAEAARRLAVAQLVLGEAGEVDARLLEDAGEGLGGLSVAVVEGTGAADVVDVLGVGLVGENLHDPGTPELARQLALQNRLRIRAAA